MDIISYRGPSCAGGVSGALGRLFDKDKHHMWCHMQQQSLIMRTSTGTISLCNVAPEVVDGHYRYCNDFLWPLMHEMPEHATFRSEDKRSYQLFNLALAVNIAKSERSREFFAQDYQLAWFPRAVENMSGAACKLFWHIPWPKDVPDEYVSELAEIVESLLMCSQIGFHIQRYANNFMNFVSRHMPQYGVDKLRRTVFKKSTRNTSCILTVQPIGLDTDYWSGLQEGWSATERKRFTKALVDVPYILSIDRADYSKGVFERLEAIDAFFALYPEQVRQVSFLQVCQRTRPGLESFDNYWTRCREKFADITSKWATENWKPIVWIDHPLEPIVLSGLYSDASVMLVNPIRDGLNLTAKEFVVCSKRGALVLSKGAGVWDELSQSALPVDPCDSEQFAHILMRALSMNDVERVRRLQQMRTALECNSLSDWSEWFSGQFPQHSFALDAHATKPEHESNVRHFFPQFPHSPREDRKLHSYRPLLKTFFERT